MKKRTDPHDDIKKQAPTFEELEAAWRRHMEHVERRVREQAPGRAEEAARLARWYAGQRSVRRRDRATLAAVFASVAVTAVAAGWLLLPRQRAQDTLTACEPPQPGIRVAAVERVPATLPAPPAPIPAKPAPVRKGEEEKPQAATAAVPPAVREEPFRYGELVCNNSCDPDSVISRICFHCGGEEVYHG